MVAIIKPVLDRSMRGLCVKEYPNHKKGCPNFNKRDRCPPKAPFLEDLYDLTKPVWVIYTRYDFGTHVKKMRAKHPEWSQRQVECCLYWQGTARKNLKNEIEGTDVIGVISVQARQAVDETDRKLEICL